MSGIIVNFFYLVAASLFILGIKMLGSPGTARRGNLVSSGGMLLAVLVTLLQGGMDYTLIVAGLLIGGVIGVVWARVVKMTGMPELVALFNGFGGLASVFVAWAEFQRVRETIGFDDLDRAGFTATVLGLTVLIGAVTFSGSLLPTANFPASSPASPCPFQSSR